LRGAWEQRGLEEFKVTSDWGKTALSTFSEKVKLSRYRLGEALGVPGG
jgi:hypothetical protein